MVLAYTRAFAATFFLQIAFFALSRKCPRACQRVLNLMYPSHARGSFSKPLTGLVGEKRAV